MDLQLVENGNGGDLIKNQSDLSVIYGFQNHPYLAMFGGNIEMSTPTTKLETEQSFDFWGNRLLMDQDDSIQFNSETERALNNTALNSAGRQTIVDAVTKDLDFMKDFSKVSVEVTIVSDNNLAIAIRLIKLDNLQKQDFVYIWSATLAELQAAEFQNVNNDVIRVRWFDIYFDIFFN